MQEKSFTLLELVIVIIIVGVLAAIALVRFFDLIESVHSVEAINTIKVIQQSVTRCGYTCISNGRTFDTCNCGDFDVLDIDDPAQASNNRFDYTVEDELHFGVNSFRFSVVARRNTVGGYTPGPDDIIKFTQCPICGDAVAIRGWGGV